MATEKQVEFFKQLQGERVFPDSAPPPETLLEQFKATSDKSASAWIEKTLTLPEKGETAPPF